MQACLSFALTLLILPSPQGAPATRAAGPLTITKVSVGPMDNNAYLLTCRADGSQVLIDAANDADTLLLVTPEHNGTVPASLKNAIDWLSRPYGAGAIVGKPLGVVGVTPTPYGGKWAHEDARRSVKIAGAIVVEDVDVSQSSIDVDVLNDPKVRERVRDALVTLVEFDPEAVSSAA
jgi:NAD(P)H-dependent FMN reductase